ncbi:hypothetical protein WKI68_22110 [Streptomyces sp. MS1.HAVA.3]|uniref:Uncharacterized protein n=1 Tax=Streptomyces caledonius TaxID=3134107 RepID=A0ABU8U7S9_9ACTN
MSFRVHTRRVRDPELPLHRRYTALGSALVLYAPFGFRRTWLHLGMFGDLRRDAEALVRGVDALELSRDARTAELATFAARRRTEKREQHRRSPSAADTAWQRARRWYGPDGHRAAVGMVRLLWAAHSGPLPPVPGEDEAALVRLDSTVCAYVSSYLAGEGAPAPDRVARLRAHLPELRVLRARLQNARGRVRRPTTPIVCSRWPK